MSHLSSEISRSADKVNKFIETVVDLETEPKVLYRAARHIIDAGGKRLRPFLLAEYKAISAFRKRACKSSISTPSSKKDDLVNVACSAIIGLAMG